MINFQQYSRREAYANKQSLTFSLLVKTHTYFLSPSAPTKPKALPKQTHNNTYLLNSLHPTSPIQLFSLKNPCFLLDSELPIFFFNMDSQLPYPKDRSLASADHKNIKGVLTHGGRYVHYNIYGNLFQVSSKYVPPIRPVGRGASGIVW